MTNLFYPSLAVYLQKRFPPPQPGPSRWELQEHPLTLFSTPLLDSVFPEIPPLIPRVADKAWWEDPEWSVSRPDEMPWLRDEVRVIRIAWTDPGNVLDGAEEWTERDWTLVDTFRQWTDGPILDLSTGSELHSPAPSALRGVAIPMRVVRGSVDPWPARLDDLAATLNAEHFVQPRSRRPGWTGRWALSVSYYSTPLTQYSKPTPPPVTGTPTIIYILYLLLFSVLGHQLSNASKVHSRFGLAFTGIVQLCCSTVMSFSILALFGWNGWGVSTGVTTLPTYILPFVIVVVGAENMSTLVSTIAATLTRPARYLASRSPIPSLCG